MREYERMVTLVDGREVSNYSEAFRAECEARAVCNMGGEYRTDSESGKRYYLQPRIVRKKYVELVAAKRGEAAAEALRALVLVVWNAEFAKPER